VSAAFLKEEWVIERIEHIRNKKSPSDQQRLLVLLCEKDDKTPKEEQDFKALVRAEKAVARLEKAAKKTGGRGFESHRELQNYYVPVAQLE